MKLLRLPLIAAYLAVLVYAVTRETGPMGWFNAAQAWLGGSYSSKLSFLLTMSAITLVFAPLGAWLWIVGDASPITAEPGLIPSSAPAREGLGSLLAFWGKGWLILVGLFWLVPLIVVAWTTHSDDTDAVARYEPLRLQRTDTPSASHDHLALEGRLLWDHALTRNRRGFSEPESTLVPVVAIDWQPGDTVRYVAQFDGGMRSWSPPAGRSSGVTIWVRVGGGVPTPALRIFEKAGAPIEGAAEIVIPVGAGGEPVPAARGMAWGTVVLWGGLGTLLATFMIVVIVLASLNEGRLGRREEKAGRAA